MTDTRTDTDLIIAGGGLAGATLALALARVVPELRVTVVETFPLSPDALPEDYQPSYDARSTALAWGSRLIFDNLGLWEVLAELLPVQLLVVMMEQRLLVLVVYRQCHLPPH